MNVIVLAQEVHCACVYLGFASMHGRGGDDSFLFWRSMLAGRGSLASVSGEFGAFLDSWLNMSEEGAKKFFYSGSNESKIISAGLWVLQEFGYTDGVASTHGTQQSSGRAYSSGKECSIETLSQESRKSFSEDKRLGNEDLDCMRQCHERRQCVPPLPPLPSNSLESHLQSAIRWGKCSCCQLRCNCCEFEKAEKEACEPCRRKHGVL